MKYNEENYKQKVKQLYNGELEVIGHFKGLSQPIIVKDRYGIIKLTQAKQLFNNRPGILLAVNRTEYFMNMLKDKEPKIYNQIHPLSEYTKMKDKMLFDTRYGIVSISPDALLAGHTPNIRNAVNRKDYFYKQLRYLYNNVYDFKIESTNRHNGKCILICPIHGEVKIDNDYIFSGCGCIKCNTNWTKSNVFYLIKLSNSTEKFYKLGITYKKTDGNLRRFDDYKKLNYNIDVLKIIEFNEFEACVNFEAELKKIIKNNLYVPQNWPNKTSTECFQEDLLTIILQNINLYMI